MALEKISNKIIAALKTLVPIVDKIKVVMPRSNLNQRILSSAVLLLLAVYAIYFSKALFFLMSIAITILISFEWLDIVKSAKDQKKWRLIGFFYILIPIWAIVEIRDTDSNILLWMFFIIWTTDIAAFFVGKSFGGAKLMPTVSPNKTWSGLIGGVVASMIIGFLSSFMFVTGNIIFFVIISGLLAVIEQGSDLVESKVKRIFKVKDSGNIIPGHGGFLDRLGWDCSCCASGIIASSNISDQILLIG